MVNRPTTSLASRRYPISRPRLVAVVQDHCTGCNACVDFCLVDCIEIAPPGLNRQSVAPISIREDECIGCFVCAKVCEELALHAIRLTSADGDGSGRTHGDGCAAPLPL